MLREYVAAWAAFSGRVGIEQIKTSALSWKLLLDDIGAYAREFRAAQGKAFVLIIDEVQWLSTGLRIAPPAARSAGALLPRRAQRRLSLPAYRPAGRPPSPPPPPPNPGGS